MQPAPLVRSVHPGIRGIATFPRFHLRFVTEDIWHLIFVRLTTFPRFHLRFVMLLLIAKRNA